MKKALLLLAGLSMLALSSCSDSDDEKLIVNGAKVCRECWS